MPDLPRHTVVVRRHRGRPPHAPTTPLGSFLLDQMRTAGVCRTELARRLAISTTTLSRLLRGQTTGARRVTESAMCEALGLTGVKRREFLRLARQAGALALAAGVMTPAQTKYAGLDLDLVDDRVAELNRLVELGEVEMVMAHARRWYEQLASSRLAPTDRRGAEAKLRVGLVLGAAQEAALPWFQRAPAVLRTYQRVEEEAIIPLPLDAFALQYAQLLERMAPVYRELGAYDQSLRRYEDGLHYARDARNPARRVDLYRNRAHVWAVRGDEPRWRHDLDAARAIAERATPDCRDVLLGLVLYSEGEGYKRLAFHQRAASDPRQQAHYAQRALASLAGAKTRAGGQRAAHLLLLEVAEAQCLVWLDPHETLRRGQQLAGAIERFMPGMMRKLDRTIQHAERRLAASRSDGAPLFNLDHPTSRDGR